MTERVKHFHIESHISSKMKKSKNEIMKNMIGSYLRKRNYNDLYTNSNAGSICKEQIAVSLQTDKYLARFNSILFSSINNDPLQLAQYFAKWLNWISCLPSCKIQSEMWSLARPLLCHLHLEALRSDHCEQIAALKRLHQELREKVHTNDLANDLIKREMKYEIDISIPVLEELANISVIQDMECYPTVQEFRSCKYQIKLSSNTVRILMDFFARHGHVMMLQVLQTWFDIEIVIEKCDNQQEFEQIGTNENETFHNQNNDLENTDQMEQQPLQDICDDTLLKEFEQSILQLEKQLPDILLYNIYNNQNDCAATCGAVNPKFEYVAVGFENSDLKIWVTKHNKCLSFQPKRIPLACTDGLENNENNDIYTKYQNEITLRGHTQTVQNVKFLQTADFILTVSHDTTMRLWSLQDGCNKALYNGHQYPIWCLDTSALDMYIATGGQDKTVRIWSCESTTPLRICAGHTLDVHSVKFHPNGLYIASGSSDRTIRLWNASDANIVRLMSVQRAVYALDFSPDGKYLASAGDDKKIQIWDLASGNQLCELKGHTETIIGLQWTNDGKYLVSATLDNNIRIWDTQKFTQSSQSIVEPSKVFSTECKNIISVQNVTQQIVAIGVHNLPTNI